MWARISSLGLNGILTLIKYNNTIIWNIIIILIITLNNLIIKTILLTITNKITISILIIKTKETIKKFICSLIIKTKNNYAWKTVGACQKKKKCNQSGAQHQYLLIFL